MKSNTICQVILAGSIILASCQSNNSAKQDESQQTMNETVMNKVTDCKISAGNITFTNAINGAENCVKLLDDGALEFHCAEDWISSVTRMENCQIQRFLFCLSPLRTRNLLR